MIGPDLDEFPRQVYFLGQWIRHGEWYPDVKLRLFKKAYGHTEGQEPHDRVIVNGLMLLRPGIKVEVQPPQQENERLKAKG